MESPLAKNETEPLWAWLVLVAMGATGGLILLDESIVGVALPTMRADLGMSESGAHWVISLYLLVFSAFAAAGGRLGDMLGLRRAFAMAMALFGLSSLAAGLAPNGDILLAARAAQGFAAAGIFPATIAVATTIFRPERRGRAMAVVASIGTVFLCAGPLVGGLLTHYVSWRWIFLINVPVVLIATATVFALWRNPPQPRPATARFDILGLTLLVCGLSLVVFAVMEGAGRGWLSPSILAATAAGIAFLALLPWAERRHEAPVLKVALLGSPSFLAWALTLFASQFTKVAVVVFGALFLQNNLGLSAVHTGAALLAAVIATPLTAHFAGHVVDVRGGRSAALIAGAIMALALAWIGFGATLSTVWPLLPAMALIGAAMPFGFLAAQRALVGTVAVHEQGQVSGLIVTARLMGGAAAAAALSAVLASSGSYLAVFGVAAGVMAVSVVALWWAAAPPRRAGAEDA